MLGAEVGSGVKVGFAGVEEEEGEIVLEGFGALVLEDEVGLREIFASSSPYTEGGKRTRFDCTPVPHPRYAL